MKKRPKQSAPKTGSESAANRPPGLTVKDIVYLAVGVVVVILVVKNAIIRDVTSDPYLNLVVSESIIENHSIKIDKHERFLISPHHGVWRHKGHVYNLYPLGTSIISLPAVYIAGKFGWRMTEPYASPPFLYNSRLQIILLSIVCAGIYIFLYLTGRLYAGPGVSFAITTISMLGSSLVSTLGTALWSHNTVILITSACIYMMARSENIPGSRLNPWLLGFLLFMAYFTRPTASLFILCVFAYQFMRSKADLLRTAGSAFVFFCLFIAFNLVEFGMPLPKYYSMTELINFSESLRGLYGILLSPSRGLLVYSPFVIVVAAGIAVYFRRVTGNGRLAVIALAWLCLHLYFTAISGWIGGWCYGARMAADAMPAAVLLTFALWREASDMPDARRLTVAASAYVLLGLAAIWLNSQQGLYNPYIQAWNSTPAINLEKTMTDNDPLYFDWRFPQFLASRDQIINRSYYVNRAELGEEKYNQILSQYGRLPNLPLLTKYPLWP